MAAIDSAEGWIQRLKLKPLEFEGGFYCETLRSDWILPAGILPAGYGEDRALYTAIYYLLTPQTRSCLHRLRGDEIFHFYAGDPVSMLQLGESSRGRVLHLGNSGAGELEPQVLVPGGVWQGAMLDSGGRYALLGTTMAPGFERADFELGRRGELLHSHPRFRAWILRLTD